MKKRILAGLAVGFLFAIGALFVMNSNTTLLDASTLNVEALASGDINPDCPNGCMGAGNGCTCYGKHPKLQVATEYWRKEKEKEDRRTNGRGPVNP